MATIGERLKKLREKKDLNQIQAAKLIGISNANLSRYEANKRNPSKENLHKLADFYHVTPSYLLFGEGKDYLSVFADVTEEEAILLKEYLDEIRAEKGN